MNVEKHVDQSVGGELQGAYVDGIEHDIGVFVRKRRDRFCAMVLVLCQPRPLFGVVERMIGKWGFAFMFRPCTRSTLGVAYRWVSAAQGAGARRVLRHPVVGGKLLCATLLLPVMQFSLLAPYSDRVVCSDAFGRSWACLDGDDF